jgi:hypothetical protein
MSNHLDIVRRRQGVPMEPFPFAEWLQTTAWIFLPVMVAAVALLASIGLFVQDNSQARLRRSLVPIRVNDGVRRNRMRRDSGHDL